MRPSPADSIRASGPLVRITGRIDELVRFAESACGPLDIMVNNAGPTDDVPSMPHEVPVSSWARPGWLTEAGWQADQLGKSQRQLAVKAVNFAFRQRAADVTPGDGIDKILRRYLSDEHLNQRGESCPIAGLGSDAALHQTEEVKAVFREGIEALIRTYEAALGDRWQ